MNRVVTGFYAVAVFGIVAAGCTESGNDRVSSRADESQSAPSPSASSPSASSPSTSSPATSPTTATTPSPSASDTGTAQDASKSDGSPSGAASSPAGSGDKQVTAIQDALKGKGHDPGAIDGIMGPRTRAALQMFQKAESIEPTGRPDERTLTALGVEADGAGTGMASPSASPRSGDAGGTKPDAGTKPEPGTK